MTDAPPTTVLTEQERADLLAGVEGLIVKKVDKSIRYLMAKEDRTAMAALELYDRDDLKQEARMEVWKATATFNPSRGAKWSTYAAAVVEQVVRRLIVDAGRSGPERDIRRLDDGERTLDIADPANHHPDDTDAFGEIEAALAGLARTGRAMVAEVVFDGLAPGHRRLVELVVIDGLDVHQIAEQLGRPVGVVKLALKQAVEKLAALGRVPAGLAAEFGLDVHDLARRGDRAAATADRLARRELIAEAGTDLPNGQLAAALGVSRSAIISDKHAIQRAGAGAAPRTVPVVGRRRRERADQDARLALVAEGAGQTAEELGAALGVCPKTIQRDRATLKRRAAKAA